MDRDIIVGEMAHSKILVLSNSTTGVNNAVLIRRDKEKVGKGLVGVIYVMGNVGIELGRPISQFIEALGYTRIPIILQRVIKKGFYESYKVTRINTGKVPNVELGYIEVYNGLMVGYIFGQQKLGDKQVLKFVKASAINMLKVKDSEDAIDKLVKALKVITKTNGNHTVIKRKRVVIIKLESKVYKAGLDYKCVLGDDSSYTVRAISIPSESYINKKG